MRQGLCGGQMIPILQEERDRHNTEALCRAFYSFVCILHETPGQPGGFGHYNTEKAQIKAIKTIVRDTLRILADKP